MHDCVQTYCFHEECQTPSGRNDGAHECVYGSATAKPCYQLLTLPVLRCTLKAPLFVNAYIEC